MEPSKPVNARFLGPLAIVKSMVTVCVLIWCGPTLCFAQNEQSADKIKLLGKIQRLDRQAILEAGRTGDRSYVPVLMSLIPRSKERLVLPGF